MSRTKFRERIRTSLQNKTLQVALDANAERRVTGRIAALATLPNWREKRQQAHAVRADVIEHLEEYLEQFTAKAEQNGIIVHRATDAAEAIKIVLDITESNVSKRWKESNTNDRSRETPILVAKSKSMVTEEINLNHALEAEGMRVVETDLGEYIVQLRGEKPAHIITPAVHLRREDVGRLFHEKLGIPYTEDIPILTDTARQVLREVFLTADVGISGVNFGVAETGTICVVSNEGNARMVTTLPAIHIALMGMERLVRNLDDLALMLSLLARSATTQKLSVYTQMVHAPFPGQQRHLILLDNGRSRMRNSPLKESLYCIRCGACLNSCPVFREIGGHAYGSTYSGPIGSVISAGFFGSDFVPLAQASSLCGACNEACPVDIDLPKLLTRVRAGQAPVSSNQLSGNRSGLSLLGTLFMKMYSLIAQNPRLFAIAQKFAALATRLVSPFSNYVPLPAFTGWGYSKDLPRFAGKTFRERFAELEVERYTGIQIDVATVPRRRRDTGTQASNEESAKELVRDENALIFRFTEELTKVSGTVIPTKPHELTEKVINFLRSRKISQIHLEPGALNEASLAKAGIIITHAPDAALRVGVTPHVSVNWKETCGVTKAVCGLADTGSILIADGEGDPLQASLLPGIHIAILCATDILPSMADAMKLAIVSQSRASVVITGPSRTADIEMSLTIGMHGPGEVHVFLVHSTASTLVHGTASTLVDD
jgi:L-lactate dehydrogenase complex protein LldF